MTLDQATAVLREHGIDVQPHGHFEGGEVGAADVRSSDGATRYALKWWKGPRSDAVRAARLVETLRSRGYPAPRFVVADEFDGWVFMMQEFAPGSISDEVPAAVVRRVIRLNRDQIGVAPSAPSSEIAHESFSAYIDRSLTDGCNGYCLHQPLDEYSMQTRQLLRAVHDAAGGAADAPAGDVVHVDFHHRNILRVDDEITAVIDWEGCRPGDATFDLVTLAFGLSVANVPSTARDELWNEVVARTDRGQRTAYAAHMALRQVDWSIRHRTPADVDHWLDVAHEYVGA